MIDVMRGRRPARKEMCHGMKSRSANKDQHVEAMPRIGGARQMAAQASGNCEQLGLADDVLAEDVLGTPEVLGDDGSDDARGRRQP